MHLGSLRTGPEFLSREVCLGSARLGIRSRLLELPGPVRRQHLRPRLLAAWKPDHNLHVLDIAQTEMAPRALARRIAISRADFLKADQRGPVVNLYLGADAHAVHLLADDLDADPVAL